MNTLIPPGETLGVLGSGQLGRMFAIAARRLGYRVHVLSPDSDTPTGQVADVEVTARYDDELALAKFASQVRIVTFEFENVPLRTVEIVGRHAPVRPSGLVLHTTQHRLREKEFLQSAGLPVTPFMAIRAEDDLQKVPDKLLPGVLKTAAWGYDGKGQAKVNSPAELKMVWQAMRQDAILERRVDFEKELSVIAARGIDGQFVCYDPFENAHNNHILDVTVCPARISPQAAGRARDMARVILEKLDVVGVLCVEFFLAPGENLIVNELAPRPHNSGHLTIDSHMTCQFEQQVRAVCGLPLGSTAQLRPAAMANLLGDQWLAGPPDWPAACLDGSLKVHLYGKRDALPGRKMGHLTTTADSVDVAEKRVRTGRIHAFPAWGQLQGR